MIQANIKPWETPSLESDVLELEQEMHSLVVYNDEVNTFEHVIKALIDYCEHTQEQAEQCTWFIHHKGKYAVKKGTWEDLVPRRNAIVNRSISAEVL